QELVGRPGAVVLGVFARHLHVTAEGNRADAILGVAPLDFEEFRAEPEGKRQHPDADVAREQKMPELVHEDQDAENEEKSQYRQFCTCVANSRAHRSIARTSSSPETCPAPLRSKASIDSRMTSGMPEKPSRSSRNAETAISFAAFSTIDSPSVPRSARNASGRHGNLSA